MRPTTSILPDDPIPPAVLMAVAALALLFLIGGVYLFISGPFANVQVVAPAEISEITAVVIEYQGTLLGIESARTKVLQGIQRLGLGAAQPITIYPISPLMMRPLHVTCLVGYQLDLAQPLSELPKPLLLKKFQPGRRLIVRVKGNGNFTGNRAYRAAEKKIQPENLHTQNSERYEVKVHINGIDYVEHWIPVQ